MTKMTKKEVKISNGRTYRMTPAGLEVTHKYGVTDLSSMTPEDVRALYSLVDDGEDIRKAKRGAFRAGIARAVELLGANGFRHSANHLRHDMDWDILARQHCPDPVRYREVRFGETAYRYKDGSIEIKHATGDWFRSRFMGHPSVIVSLADLINNPVEKGSDNG